MLAGFSIPHCLVGWQVLLPCRGCEGSRSRTSGKEILVADVKASVGVGGKHGGRVASNIAGAAVLVAEGITDLSLRISIIIQFIQSSSGRLLSRQPGLRPRTKMLTVMPSPLKPPTVDLALTMVSRLTKLRMQRSLRWLSPPVCAASSNLRALAAERRKRRPQSHCSVNEAILTLLIAFLCKELSSGVGG